MTSTEDRARAAMRAIAGTVHDAPPLLLAPAHDASARDEVHLGGHGTRRRSGPLRPGGARGQGRHDRGRRWQSWLVPLTAAAAVVALAVSLVVVKDIPNGTAIPAGPTTSTTGPGGVPRYYVALTQFSGSVRFAARRERHRAGRHRGGGLAYRREDSEIRAPAHTTFQSVMAAADDLTFVVFAVSSSTGSFDLSAKGATLTGSWFEVKLAPGTADPARLTPLPIKPWSWAPEHSVHDYSIPSPGKVFATALSQNGQELAVADIPPLPAGDLDTAQNWQEVKVFSVATGQLLHDWNEHDPSAAFGDTDWWVPIPDLD